MATEALKILAIDDNPDNLITLKAVVRDALPGAAVLTTLSGPQGIALARAEDPDVILLDIVMPGMDGYAVCRALKADPRTQPIPVVFLTALRADRESRIQALEAGAEAFLAKPLDEIELSAQIRAMAKIKAANRMQRLEREQLAALVVERTVELEQELAERKQAEAALEEALGRLTRAQRIAHIGSWSDYLPTHQLDWSEEMYRLLGFPPHTSVNLTEASCIFPPEEWARFQQAVGAAINADAPYNMDYRIVRPDGAVRHIHDEGEIVRDEQGQAIWMHGTTQDITERKQAETALRESEARFRVIFEHANDAIHVSNADDAILQVNPRMCELLGYSREELLTLRVSDLQAPEVRGQSGHVIRNALARHGNAAFESVDLHRSGRRIPVEVSVARIESAQGDLYVSIVRDITERKRAEAELHRINRFLDAIIENIPNMIFLKEAENLRFVRLNRAGEHLLGLSREEVLGKNDYDFFPQAEAEFFIQKDRQALQGQVIVDIPEETIQTRFQGQRILHTQKVPILNAHGEPEYLLGISEDITERKRVAQDYRSLFHTMLEGFAVHEIICDEQGQPADYRFLTVNPAFERMTGLKAQAIVGRTVREVLPGTEQHWIETYGQVALTGKPAIFESYTAALQKHFEVTAFRPASHQFACIFADITERKRAEEALKERERTFATLISNLPGFVYRCANDPDWTMKFISEGCREITGYDLEDFLGSKPVAYNDLVVFDFRKPLWDRWQDILKMKGIFQEEYPILARNGATRWVWERGRGIFADDGQLLFLEGFITDITERKRVEAERERLLAQVQAQAQQIAQLMDTVPEGVLLLDADGQVLLANPAGVRDLATLAGATVGKRLTHLGELPLAELLAAAARGGPWHEVRAGGRSFEAIARPVVAGSPAPEQWVLVINDVTLARDLREQLQQQERLAAVGQLAAGIAHDFNNILAVIALQAPLVARAPTLAARDRERLTIISEQTGHATRLIQQLLDFSRRAVLERRPLDLGPLLQEQVKLLARTLPETIAVTLDCVPGEYVVLADPTRLQQLLMNLAVNARDAMPAGGTLRLTLARQETAPRPDRPAGPWVRLTVADSGTGIAPEVQAHLFEPFFTTKPRGQGTGLGLAQVHGIVKQHAGEIEVQSAPGQGVTFTIYLPAVAAPAAAPAAAVAAPPVGAAQLILIVEDNAVLLDAMTDSVELLGYRVVGAGNGVEALAVLAARGDAIALVLSDLVMPVLGGEALLRAMRARGFTTPVVMLSGHPLEGELEGLKTEGLAGWLLKPPDLADLARLLAQALAS